MRFYLQRSRQTMRRVGAWLNLFWQRLRHTVTRRFVLAPMLCFISLWLYSHYVTQLNLFLIIEQGRVTVHETYTQDAESALAELGISIRGTDRVSLPQGLLSGAAGEIEIVRSSDVYVSLDGVTVPVNCLGGTVSDALDKAGYKASPSTDRSFDIISPSPETPIEEGMAITVTRIKMETRYENDTIPFDEEIIESPTVNFGAEVTTTEGEEGLRTKTYEVTYRDGVKLTERMISDEVVKEPVKQVIVRGTGGTIQLADGTRIAYKKRLEVICTAYTTERQVNKINAIGNVARVGTIAVDPKVIPLRTKVYVTSRNGTWVYGGGIAICEDTGGAVKGNIIDLYFDTWDECVRFGRQKGYLYIL